MSPGLPGLGAGQGGIGKGLNDPRIMVASFILGELVKSFSAQKRNPNYRRIGPGAWARNSQVDTSSINPAGYTFYAQHKNSLKDDGTISGSASVLKSPIWLAKYLLVEFGGLDATNDFEATAGAFGNFATAASDLDALVSADWEAIYRHLTPGNLDAALDRICSQAPIAIWQSNQTGKWMAEVFNRTVAPRQKFKDSGGNVYYWHLQNDFLPYGEPMITWTDPEHIVNEVHVHYRMAGHSGQYTADCWVGPDGSDDGTGTRDQTGAAGTSTDREVRATDSRNDWHIYNRIDIYADQIYRQTEAVVLRNYLFDTAYRPRMVFDSATWNRAATLEPNQVIYLDHASFIDDYPVMRYPDRGGSQKAWNQFAWLVTDVQRSGGDMDVYQVTAEEIL